MNIDAFETFLIIVVSAFRVGGLLFAMPMFGATFIPASIRFLMALGFAAALAPLQQIMVPLIFTDNSYFLLVLVKEISIGVVMGFCVRFIFLTITMSLEFVSMQMGFSMAHVFDPQSNSQVSIVAQWGTLLAMLVFLTLNGLEEIFSILVRSYTFLPLGPPSWDLANIMENLVSFLSLSFELAIKISMPIMMAMLLIQFVVGLIARIAPQLNLFFNMTFVINLVSGLLMLFFMVPQFLPTVRLFQKVLEAKGYGVGHV